MRTGQLTCYNTGQITCSQHYWGSILVSMGYRKYHDAHPLTPTPERSDYMFNSLARPCSTAAS
jgi:hypothetical protein